jgi:hypothetical protein
MRFAWLPFVAAFIFAGCDGYKIVDCTPEQQEYIDQSFAWTVANSAVIDSMMAEHWKKPRSSMSKVIDALESANLQCGIGNKEGDGVAASHVDPGNRIVLDVGDSHFHDSFRQWDQARWTVEFTLAELDDKSNPRIDRTEHPSPFNDSLQYEASLSFIALLLLHEADHEVVGDHTEEAKERAAEIREEYGPLVDAWHLRLVDATYALGYWAVATATVLWEEKRDVYFATLDASS